MLILDIFILSCFISFFAIWNVTPVLHSPLMSVTNAISGIIIIGALELLQNELPPLAEKITYISIFFASINIFGGFFISIKMLNLFKPKDKNK
ncbi:MAG: NAD(P) transhydrogenase subunit alpha [Alphaproteobacteria bacterium]|nr:NAD(P) transhydrogenase subunit alpha [Alphaproteobacteria bacterium]